MQCFETGMLFQRCAPPGAEGGEFRHARGIVPLLLKYFTQPAQAGAGGIVPADQGGLLQRGGDRAPAGIIADIGMQNVQRDTAGRCVRREPAWFGAELCVHGADGEAVRALPCRVTGELSQGRKIANAAVPFTPQAVDLHRNAVAAAPGNDGGNGRACARCRGDDGFRLANQQLVQPGFKNGRNGGAARRGFGIAIKCSAVFELQMVARRRYRHMHRIADLCGNERW